MLLIRTNNKYKQNVKKVVINLLPKVEQFHCTTPTKKII